MSETPAAERARLASYIDGSRRVRRRLRIVLAVAAALTVAGWMVDSTLGLTLVLITIFVGGIGFYITWAHIQDWTARLAELDRRDRDPTPQRGRAMRRA